MAMAAASGAENTWARMSSDPVLARTQATQLHLRE
jgi:hypothetical protein